MARVGLAIATVLVGCTGGRVGVLKGASWVDCACTVKAAAVNTTFGSGVGEADGRLQAERMSTKILTIDRIRKVFNMLSPQFGTIFYTNTDGHILPFVPKPDGCASMPLHGSLEPDLAVQTDFLRVKTGDHASSVTYEYDRLKKKLFR
jgi:hypothetical protein